MKSAVGIFFILFLLFFYSGKAQNDNSGFLDNLTSFDKFLSENDSLKVIVDMSICTGTHQEKLVFTKQNDTVFIQGNVHADYYENLVLKKNPYLILEKDTLNFENLFLKRIDKNIEKRKTSSFIYEIFNTKGDTLRLFCDGLIDMIGISIHHFNIMNRLYPNEEIYIPDEILQKPEDKEEFPEFELEIK